MSPRRVLAIAAFASLLATTIQPELFRVAAGDRAAEARAVDTERAWPGYGAFLDGVREHSRPGDRIALAFPATRWDRQYDQAYYRASYVLAGREVLPLMDRDNRPLRQNVREADLVAVYRGTMRGAQVVWAAQSGSLVRPAR